MYPIDFLTQYGPTRFRTVNLSGGAFEIARYDGDRYLLVIMAASATIAIGPTTNLLSTDVIWLASQTAPVIMTHALHGAMVNMQWFGRASGPPGGAIIIEGWMKKPTDPVPVACPRISELGLEEEVARLADGWDFDGGNGLAQRSGIRHQSDYLERAGVAAPQGTQGPAF